MNKTDEVHQISSKWKTQFQDNFVILLRLGIDPIKDPVKHLSSDLKVGESSIYRWKNQQITNESNNYTGESNNYTAFLANQ